MLNAYLSIPAVRLLRVKDLREIAADFEQDTSGPALLLSAAGETVTVGPLYVPGSGVCAACAAYRARTAGWNRPAAASPSQEALRVMEAAANEVLAAFHQGALMGVLLTSLWEIDSLTGIRRLHPVMPRADCPRCGQLCGPLLDSSRPLSDHCSPLTGILASVAVTSQPFAGSYSAMGDYVAPLPAPDTRLLLRAQTALGKGHSPRQAIDSCIGEALERYSLIYRGTERFVRARLGETHAIDPRDILLVSENQYANREAWNASHHDRYWIPESFDPDETAIDLLEAVDLNAGKPILVPAACCLMWYRFKPGETKFASADSIGCGAGRTLAEATASAILEWIERDAMAIWWYNRAPRPGVLPERFNSAYLNRIRDGLRERNRDLWLLDIRNEIDIPVYAAISPSMDGTEPVFAAAAHPSPRVAAEKAAAEIAQILFSTFEIGALDPEFHRWLNSATIANQPWLAPSALWNAPHEPAPLSAAETVARCVERLSQCGLRAIAVDQSRSDVQLKTVRAIVPGLRHIWARFAPGRLYDLPVRLGWRETALTEAGLNSILCMI